MTTTTRRQMLAGLAVSTIAAGSTAAKVSSSTETAQAAREYAAAKANFDNRPPRNQAEDDAAYQRFLDAQRAIMTSPTTTPEDIALKLEYALAEELCGGEFIGEMARLDNAMFRGMIDALRAMQVEG